MTAKRILLVSVSIVGLLAIALGVAGFVLTSNSSAKSNEAVTNPPAAVSEQQAASEYEAKLETYFSEPASLSGTKDFMSEGDGCHHDSAFNWSAED
jgi:hypothetical protein